MDAFIAFQFPASRRPFLLCPRIRTSSRVKPAWTKPGFSPLPSKVSRHVMVTGATPDITSGQSSCRRCDCGLHLHELRIGIAHQLCLFGPPLGQIGPALRLHASVFPLLSLLSNESKNGSAWHGNIYPTWVVLVPKIFPTRGTGVTFLAPNDVGDPSALNPPGLPFHAVNLSTLCDSFHGGPIKPLPQRHPTESEISTQENPALDPCTKHACCLLLLTRSSPDVHVHLLGLVVDDFARRDYFKLSRLHCQKSLPSSQHGRFSGTARSMGRRRMGSSLAPASQISPTPRVWISASARG